MTGVPPTTARVRMYQVGFGDCFLLTFEYAAPLPGGRNERHVLFDFGTMARPQSDFEMEDIAKLIREHTHGHLDVLVVSHRHRDHISAFGQDAIATIINDLAPGIVVQPWTEDPALGESAQGPLGVETVRFQTQLAAIMDSAQELLARVQAAGVARLGERYEVLTDLAADQVPNAKAVANLARWADGRSEYVYAGKRASRIEKQLPGVKVRVLGPPTLKQHPAIASYAGESPEYWITATRSSAIRLYSSGPGSAAGTSKPPAGPARRAVERLQQESAAALLSIVRVLDSFLNNTSVILLFEAGEKRLLFGGDAQIENWGYALGKASNRKRLRSVHFYKVGHHGSRNATPRRLFDLWNKAPPEDRVPMTAMMSTLEDVHGEVNEVPRRALVSALRKRSTLHSTQDFASGQLFLEVKAGLASDAPFEIVTAP